LKLGGGYKGIHYTALSTLFLKNKILIIVLYFTRTWARKPKGFFFSIVERGNSWPGIPLQKKRPRKFP
jgi:hypothetical protein